MATDPISIWLAGLFTELAKEAAKGGAQQFAKWLDGTRGEEARAMNVALALALDDFKRYGNQARAEQFRAFLSERQAANDTAFGDAILRALLAEPSGAIALSPDLQSRVPVDLHPAALEFLSDFHRRLWSQPPFDRLLQAKDAQDDLRIALRSLEAFERISPRPDYAAEEQRYLAQLIANTELLEFVGIPDPRQNAAIKLEDIFVPLGATEEVEIQDLNVEMPKVKKVIPVQRVAHSPEIVGVLRDHLPLKIARRVTLDDALRSHTRLMILGDPGAGKSTLLRYLALVAARAMMGDAVGAINEGLQQEPRLPVLIALRDFAASKSDSLVDFFYTNAKRLQVELSRGFFERALEDGRCIVCLDGLDEVVVSDQRVAVRDAVAAFANRYGHNNRIIVTSRIVGYESVPLDRRAFAHHTILPFTEKEIESFVYRWYAAREREPQHAKAQAEQLCKTIKESDRLRKLAENPLMLTIIALVHRVEAELPNERVKLYDKCTESLLSTWEGVKGLAHDRERTYFKHRRRLLEKLAFWMHTLSQEVERQAEVKRGDLKAKLIAFLLEDPKLNLSADLAELEAEAFIELAKSRTGILVERGDGIYSFVHLTFQEYFAACDLEKRYVTNLERLWKQIRPHLYDPHWREVVLLLLGRLNEYDEPPNIIVKKILRGHDRFDDVLHRNLFLAARCLGDHVNINEAILEEIIDTLLEFAREEPPRYWSLRENALQTLATLGHIRSAGDGLAALAQDRALSEDFRRRIVETLAEARNVNLLLMLLQNQTVEMWFRKAVAVSLRRLGHLEQAAQSLVTLAQDENVWIGIRIDSVNVLEHLASADELSVLARDQRIEAVVRNAASRALADIERNSRLMASTFDSKPNSNEVYDTFEADNVLTEVISLMERYERVRKRYAKVNEYAELGRVDKLLEIAHDPRKEESLRDLATYQLGRLTRENLSIRLYRE